MISSSLRTAGAIALVFALLAAPVFAQVVADRITPDTTVAAPPGADEEPGDTAEDVDAEASVAPDEAPSENDQFANRLEVADVRFSHIANNASGAANEAGEPVPSCGASIGKTVWYEFQPPTTGQYLLTSLGSSFNTIMAVYTGTWGAMTQVGCSDDAARGLQAQLTLTLDSAQTYYIQLGGKGTAAGNFKFFVVDPSDALVPGAPTISAAAVGAPSAPVANGANTNSPEPVVAWTPRAPVTPYAYVVQVSKVATFTSIVASQTVVEPSRFWAIGSLPPSALAAGQKYYWRVAARNFLGQASAQSPTYSFTHDTQSPAVPQLTAPAANGVSTSPRPKLTWTAVTGATGGYRVRLAADASCSIELGGGVVATTTYTPATDLVQGEFWFCVEALDVAGNTSGFGEKRRFVVNIALTPANGANVIASPPAYTSNVTFTWGKIAANIYRLQVATDPGFAAPIVNTPTLTVNTYTMTGQPSGRYYWRVLTNGSPVSPVLIRTFTITPAPPVAPLIQTAGALAGAVPNAGVTNDTTPVLDWTVPTNWVTPPLGQTISYEVQLSTSAAFATMVAGFPVAGIVPSDHELSGSLPDGTYYWRVRAVTSLGVNGAFSAAYRFTVDTQPPPPPALTAPVVGGVVSTLRPAFKWNAAPGAVRYGVQVASNFSCSTLIPGAQGEVTTLTYTPPVDLPQGEYWFCVKSRDAAGNWGDFGEKRRFVINVSLLPANGATFIATAPSFSPSVVLTWSNVPGANYVVEIATDSSFAVTVSTAPLTTTSYTVTGRSFGTYYWRVLVSGMALPQSLARSFTITPALPSAPLIQTAGAQPGAVTNGGFTNDQTPVLDWTVPANWVPLPPAQSLTYEVQLSTSSTFSPLVEFPVTGIPDSHFEWSVSALPSTPGTVYYWRVRAVTNLGLAGPFSAAYRFTLDTGAPNLPSLGAPADGAVSTSARPAFSWSAVAGANRYSLEIEDETSFDSPVYAATVATTAHTPTQSLAQGVYYWHVFTLDAAGNESVTATAYRTLTIDYRTAPTPGKVIAAPNPAGVPVLFTWVAPAAAPAGTTYTIEIDFDLDGNPDMTRPPVTGVSTTSPVLPPGNYQYRLAVGNGFGTSGWRSFVISGP